MKGDGVLNLLIFQAFQDVRMASSPVCYTNDKRERRNLSLLSFKNVGLEPGELETR